MMPPMANLRATPAEEAACQKLLDEYARSKHKCFVSEFFLSTRGAYSVCVRPLGSSKTDPNRYACKYLQFAADDVRAMSSATAVPLPIADALDKALSGIRTKQE